MLRTIAPIGTGSARVVWGEPGTTSKKDFLFYYALLHRGLFHEDFACFGAALADITSGMECVFIYLNAIQVVPDCLCFGI